MGGAPLIPSGEGQFSKASRRAGFGLIFVIWLAFHFPAFAGKVFFPVDIARTQPPISLYEKAAPSYNPEEGDFWQFYYPWHHYLGKTLREGRLPLWDPYRFAGTPFAADANAGVWYPPNWLFALPNTLLVESWLVILSRLAALLMAYWFFRVIRLHPFAAVAGAVAFTFAGFMMVWSDHPSFIGAAMWLPLVLGGLETSFRGRPRVGIPLGGLGLALSLLGGQPQITIYVWLAAAAWAGVSIAGLSFRKAPGGDPAGGGAANRLIRNGSITGAIFAIGVGLSSLQILSGAEISSRIVRGKNSYEMLTTLAMPFKHLATLLIPDRFGNPLDHNYSGFANYHEGAVYAGVFALVLTLFALALRRERVTAGFLTIAGLGTLAATGTPFYRILYSAVPFLSQGRAINRFSFLIGSGIAGLAAIGLDEVLAGQKSRRRRGLLLAAAGILVLAAIVVSTVRGPKVAGSYLQVRSFRAEAFVITGTILGCIALLRRRWSMAAGLVIALLVAGDMWAFAFRYHRLQAPGDVYPRVPEVKALSSVKGVRPRLVNLDLPWLPANAAPAYELYDVGGGDPFILTRYAELVSIAESQMVRARDLNFIGPFTQQGIRSPIMNLLGVREILAGNDASGLGKTVFNGKFSVRDPGTALPPAFVAGCWEVHTEQAALEQLGRMSSEGLRSTAIVDETPEARTLPTAPAGGACTAGPDAKIEAYRPERVEITASPTKPSVLVLTDAWFPGWKATVDGRATPILVVDHTLRGVALPQGRHRVRFDFRPEWLADGAIATAGTAMATLAGVLIAAAMSRRRRRTAGSSDGDSG